MLRFGEQAQKSLDYKRWKKLRDSVPKRGYRWPSSGRMAKTTGSGRSLSDLLYGRNPKMAKKKRRKRKNEMPAALKAYWAKKRRAKNARRRKRRKSVFSRSTRRRAYGLLKRAVRHNRVRNYRRRRKHNARRRRRNVVRRVRARRITVPFAMTPEQTRKFASALRRATGRRVRILK